MELSELSLERFLSKTEDFLTKLAAIPVFGILPGLNKVALGVIQTCSAVIAGVILSPTLLKKGRHIPLERCWVHILHGLGNIAAGGLEAIPGVGYLSYRIHNLKGEGLASDVAIRVDHSYTHKFMPYPEPVKKTVFINASLGIDAGVIHEDQVDKIKELFRATLEKENPSSVSRIIEIGEEIIRNN